MKRIYMSPNLIAQSLNPFLECKGARLGISHSWPKFNNFAALNYFLGFHTILCRLTKSCIHQEWTQRIRPKVAKVEKSWARKIMLMNTAVPPARNHIKPCREESSNTTELKDHLTAEISRASEDRDSQAAFHCYSADWAHKTKTSATNNLKVALLNYKVRKSMSIQCRKLRIL